jgi:hypothetical protein
MKEEVGINRVNYLGERVSLLEDQLSDFHSLVGEDLLLVDIKLEWHGVVVH